MAIADVLLLWSGEQAIGQQSSRGGPVSKARPTEFRRFSMSFAVDDVVPVSGGYPRPGVDFVHIEHSGVSPWLNTPSQAHTLVVLDVIEVNSVARTVRATYSVQSFMTGSTVFTSNYTMYFSETEWGEFSDCNLMVGFMENIRFRMNPSLVTLGSRSFRVFPYIVHPDTYLSHTGSVVSGQTIDPIKAMEVHRQHQHVVFPVFLQNFPEFTPQYQSEPFSGYVTYDWTTGEISLIMSGQSAGAQILHNTGLQYRKYYVAAHQAWVVMCVDTNWFGTYGVRHRQNISNSWLYYRVVPREDGFFLPQVLRGGTTYNNLQSRVGYYLLNISDSNKTVYLRRSATAIDSGYSLATRDDMAAPGQRWVKSMDGATPGISDINIGSGGGVATISPQLMGDLLPGEYGGFWLLQSSNTNSPADEMWMPLVFEIAAI